MVHSTASTSRARAIASIWLDRMISLTAAITPINPPARCHWPSAKGCSAMNCLIRATAVRIVSPWRSRNIRVTEPLAYWSSAKREMSPGSDTESSMAIRLPLIAPLSPSSR
ncbi:hypothetical protein D3C86_1667670 [compost metagenome]